MTLELALLFMGGLGASLLMGILWGIQYRDGDAGIADVGWAGAIALLALIYSLAIDGFLPRQLLLAAMGSLWGGRLGFYLFVDRIRAGNEDGRYQMLRAAWGDKTQTNFFLFFQFQAVLIFVFSLPFLIAARQPLQIWRVWDSLGLLIWCIAILGELVADRQLAGFRRLPENTGRTCRTGLWRYSRHPNYFFEWIHWWSYVVIALGAPYGKLTILVPLFMFLLLFQITGIPYTEKRAVLSRGEDYRRYQRETSAFFPWFPRKKIHAKFD